MTFALRDYQQFAVDSLPAFWSKTPAGHPLLAMPTGTGKSWVLAGAIQWMYRANPQARVVVATHVRKLIVQNEAALLKLWPQAPVGVFSAGLNRREIKRITICGIQSIVAAVNLLGHIDVFFIDEAHLLSPSDKTRYRKVIKALMAKNKAMKVVGLTATGWRLGQGSLTEEGGIFTHIACDMTDMESFNWFIRQGYMAPLIPKKTKLEFDVSGVHIQGGEYNQKELGAAVNKAEITESALRETLELADDRKHWLVFASSVEHAVNIQEMLQWLGISCNIVHSKQSDDDNDEQYAGWESGSVRAIVNYGVLTTGVDFAEIDCIVMLRATASSSLWVQMLGRGTRPVYVGGFDLGTQAGRLASISASGKENCLVLDFGGNSKRLGPINDPLIPNPKGKKKGVAPVKLCEACDMWNHSSARFCGGKPFKTNEGCGHEFIFKVNLTETAGTGELIKSGEMPIIESMVINRIEYSKHEKAGGVPSLKVTYWNNINSYSEYICLEHTGLPRSSAVAWWTKRRPDAAVPSTVDEALFQTGFLTTPTHMRVHVNLKYPRILAFCFDGTNFNAQPATMHKPRAEAKINMTLADEFIPF